MIRLSQGNVRLIPLYAGFCLILILNIGLWLYSRDLRSQWGNVPPVMSEASAAMATGGDRQFAYRVFAMMLQNLGMIGGKDHKFGEYDYNTLREWFFLESNLDPVSNFIPALAAFYYGSTKDAEDLTPVVDYLAVIGQRPEPHKWRWLAHAVYIARYQQGDMNRALELAHLLAGLDRDDMPPWARQMPVFVMNAKGDKQAAYAMMMGILASSADKMSPIEVRFIRDYVCGQILTPDEAAREPLCADVR